MTWVIVFEAVVGGLDFGMLPSPDMDGTNRKAIHGSPPIKRDTQPLAPEAGRSRMIGPAEPARGSTPVCLCARPDPDPIFERLKMPLDFGHLGVYTRVSFQ